MTQPVVRQMMIIVDDNVGEGPELAFPKVSTCSAVVAVLPNTLVGGHFTADTAPNLQQAAAHTQANAARMQELIGEQPIGRLLIVGYNANHNPDNVRRLLGCAAGGRHPNATVEAYDIARKGIVEVMLVFTHAGAQQRPRVEFKRQSKSAATMRAQRFGPDGDKLGFGREGSVTITSTQHFLRRHFVQL